ncbi:hypothetical protein DH86_00002554 [Scytalidium sp. 3C]|nr:hypothetical protein DH86_00002554 [Scytalidium sp. 3C]
MATVLELLKTLPQLSSILQHYPRNETLFAKRSESQTSSFSYILITTVMSEWPYFGCHTFGRWVSMFPWSSVPTNQIWQPMIAQHR